MITYPEFLILQSGTIYGMPSSKGKPTDPELREEIKEGIIDMNASLRHIADNSHTSSRSQTKAAAARGSGQLGRFEDRRGTTELKAD